MAARRPAPREMSIGTADGSQLDMAIRPPADSELLTMRSIAPIPAHFFNACPICGDRATTAEHVPPAAIGGRVVTGTCERCNNQLGTRVEPDLIDWVDGAVGRVAFTGDAVMGPRYAHRVLHRTTPAGEFVLVIDGKFDESIRDLLNAGEVEFTATAPDPNRLALAALKQAYLSACVYLRAIPAGTEQVRAELIAARDAPSREEVPYSPMAAGVEILRLDPASGRPPAEPLVHAVAEIHGVVEQGALLGGVVFVSWSSDPAPAPATSTTRRFTDAMQIQGKSDGTVISVSAGPRDQPAP